MVWSLGSVALLWPSLTVSAARALGIGRGADLLLYSTVLATTWGFFFMYTRLRRLDRQLTVLVRQLAIARAATPPAATETALPGAQR